MGFRLNEKGYFQDHGVNVIAFSDFYPEGHQSGVTLLMHDKRMLANGDVRFEQTPGQWQPVPKQDERIVDRNENRIVTTLSYPDMSRHLHGFNPMIYPDFEFSYKVAVEGTDRGVLVHVDLDREIPDIYAGKLCFNLELFPGEVFDKPWIMDESFGTFPRQANSPTRKQASNYELSSKMKPISEAKAVMEKLSGDNKGYNPIIADDLIAEPYAVGHALTVCPDDPLLRFTVRTEENVLKLYDGRMNHNNGWFVINVEIPAHVTENAVALEIVPNVVEDWMRPAVVQTSQVGYHTLQPKKALVELDERENDLQTLSLQKLTPMGYETVKTEAAVVWGNFLRYKYVSFDFSEINEPGLYRVLYGETPSSVFKIGSDVYERGVWQPVVEYFLPVQMCHMRVNEKYRVWHGRCHCDDGRMAPLDYEQFDGAAQGPDNLTKWKPGQHVPGFTRGGWHDAGDFDLRIESQTGEMYHLAAAYEEFGAYLDETDIDQETRTVEIHQPDGKNDVLQQLEHGALSVVNAYKSLGRLYHEVMCGDLRQYVLLGDPVNMTSGVEDGADERLIFTEDNPDRELQAAARLAGSYRALKGFNDELSGDCLNIAEELYQGLKGRVNVNQEITYDPLVVLAVKTEYYFRVYAACELLLSTGDAQYRKDILDRTDLILEHIDEIGWIVCRALKAIDDEEFTQKVREALLAYKKTMDQDSASTPYGIVYSPAIWGAGWGIQEQASKYYFLHKAFPDIFGREYLCDALNFILGLHPGSNTESFASGVGTRTNTIAYGLNRADWSCIPGGVSSGTALIRPDFPELLEFPYLWQQKEYVIGGGSTNYMFLVLAVDHVLKEV